MKTKVIAASAIAALLLVGVGAVALANTGAASALGLGSSNSNGEDHNSQGTPQSDHGSDNGADHEGGSAKACANFTVGETLTVSGLEGKYFNATDHRIHGNATGTFTFKVDKIYATGCMLTITGGSFKLNKTSYSVTGGTIVLSHEGHSGEGTGSTSSRSFLIRVDGLHGTSKSASVGQVGLDFKNGSQEFLIRLGSPESED
jgi:hypothetical protein